MHPHHQSGSLSTKRVLREIRQDWEGEDMAMWLGKGSRQRHHKQRLLEASGMDAGGLAAKLMPFKTLWLKCRACVGHLPETLRELVQLIQGQLTEPPQVARRLRQPSAAAAAARVMLAV